MQLEESPGGLFRAQVHVSIKPKNAVCFQPSGALCDVETSRKTRHSGDISVVRLGNLSLNAMPWTVIIAATASESAPLQFLAPYAGCTIAEYSRDIGEPTVIIYEKGISHRADDVVCWYTFCCSLQRMI